jgi:adenine phosphoribosyltransferase
MSENLYRLVRDVPDFPKPGVLFRDITPILLDPAAMVETVNALVHPLRGLGVTKVVAIESRGFLIGAPAAMAMGAGLVIVRKPGKLPADARRVEYDLEYGTDALEVHTDALVPADVVAVVDDVLATGGTAQAAAALVGQAGSVLAGFSFLIELVDLGGRQKLLPHPVHSVLRFPRP